MKKKKLKTLEENNAQAFQFNNQFSNAPQPNGVACPRCGSELFDSCPMITLTSNPVQKNVHCELCEYVGYRFV